MTLIECILWLLSLGRDQATAEIEARAYIDPSS
jgi:hypothetical protein